MAARREQVNSSFVQGHSVRWVSAWMMNISHYVCAWRIARESYFILIRETRSDRNFCSMVFVHYTLECNICIFVHMHSVLLKVCKHNIAGFAMQFRAYSRGKTFANDCAALVASKNLVHTHTNRHWWMHRDSGLRYAMRICEPHTNRSSTNAQRLRSVTLDALQNHMTDMAVCGWRVRHPYNTYMRHHHHIMGTTHTHVFGVIFIVVLLLGLIARRAMIFQ